jgi:catechol 2,3-dioxygenase-like lactoylglutathione lyase family enzyme
VFALAFVIVLAGGSENTAVAQLVKSVETVGVTVSDVDRSTEFFNKVLNFEKIGDVEVHGEPYEKLKGLFGLRMRVVRMQLGKETIELTQYLAPEGRPIPPGWRTNDHTFQHIAIVVSDMDEAYRHLHRHKVRHASTGPQTIPANNPAAAGIRAFYFKDPDGHHLEIIYFPAGKGDPRWQQSNGPLFLGIDHSAIVVSDTTRSLHYYRDLLGMRVTGESLNSGSEQERLNNVSGARLRITGLRAQRGPGIEFLEYLAPRNGRRAPQDTRTNDIWHWQTVVATASADEAAKAIRAGGKRITSPAAAALPDKTLGFTRGFSARDPDGHGIQFIER